MSSISRKWHFLLLGIAAGTSFMLLRPAQSATFQSSQDVSRKAASRFEVRSDNYAEVSEPRNVLGEPLGVCSAYPLTGFFRNGKCETGPQDAGTHTVCSKVTKEFLEFTMAQGNDLVTPRPQFRFPGLKPGDGWCLCASRWREAMEHGVAPPVVLEATHEKTLRFVDVQDLNVHAVAPSDPH